MFHNSLVSGNTGSGKSKATVRELLRWKGAIVLLDWHTNSTASDLLKHAPEERVLYDNLSDPEHALCWDFFPRSNHRNHD